MAFLFMLACNLWTVVATFFPKFNFFKLLSDETHGG